VNALTLPRPLRAAGALALLVAVFALALAAPRSAAAQAPEDGCDPSEPIACIPLPDGEGDGEPDGPTASIAAPRVPQPPVPCPPALGGEARIAAPVPPPPACDRRSVVATINRANVLFARALRAVNANELPEVWADGALQMVRGYVAYLRQSGLYATPELHSITLEELRVSGGRATVRTLENWLYQERSRFSGRVTYQDNQWVANLYELELRGRSWFVVHNETALVPAPLPRPGPPPPPSPPCIDIFPPPPGCGQPPLPPVTLAILAADRPVYRFGETIMATISNIGTLTLTGGGGYRCGLIELEYLTSDGAWVRAPGASEVCPAIGQLLRPGESRTERFRVVSLPGWYRLTAHVSSEWQSETFHSEQFYVLP
jgi:hypothetical protein